MITESFNFNEVLEMAKDIEVKGREFYNEQAEKTDNKEAEQLFLRLAGDEDDHYQRFNEIQSQFQEKTGETDEYISDPQVGSYLEALVEFTVFPADKETGSINSLQEVLDMAIRAEKDSILLYNEMKENNEGETRKVIEKLIEEEKNHLIDLLKLDAEI